MRGRIDEGVKPLAKSVRIDCRRGLGKLAGQVFYLVPKCCRRFCCSLDTPRLQKVNEICPISFVRWLKIKAENIEMPQQTPAPVLAHTYIRTIDAGKRAFNKVEAVR
jgi:hypothetical protein